MSLLYKTLFEIKLMHEYYVTGQEGKTVFELTNQTDRINFLLDQFSEGRPAMNADMEYRFPDSLESTYSGRYLKILPAYSGFKVLVRVLQSALPDGTQVYQPLIPLPDDFNIYIQLVKRSGSIDSYTQSGIYDAMPSAYTFSNENIQGPKTFPFLTNNVPVFDAAHSYTQGDIASYGANDIREYYKDTSGDQWEPVPGSAFANESDRLLVPLKFFYSFINTSNITSAVFILKDKNDNTVKTINVNGVGSAQKSLLDFSDVADKISVPESFLYPDVLYSLEVTGDNGYSKSHTVIFNDALYSRNNWGIINIKTKVTNSLFNLLANDGFLIKRKVLPNTWVEAPIFEIPIKSRFLFWRFINDKGKELDLAAALTDYLFKENKILLTKRPRSLAGSYFKLQKQGSTDTVYVPNPLNYDLKRDSSQRLCLDIMVPESELFPIV